MPGDDIMQPFRAAFDEVSALWRRATRGLSQEERDALAEKITDDSLFDAINDAAREGDVPGVALAVDRWKERWVSSLASVEYRRRNPRSRVDGAHARR